MQVMFDPASMDHELLSAFGLLRKFCATCRDGPANQQLLEAHAEGTILGAESAIFKRIVVRDEKKLTYHTNDATRQNIRCFCSRSKDPHVHSHLNSSRHISHIL